ncbi:hypothetical protein BKA66DRAFT_458562 [Pyrenochaeta sp. MPI-SDFR-AT-0127]|nr:hypothetical protein BKA66DRAFT_458562 [Pyrenochaeta sp. MPI-SDFR-AT-0127]
MGYGLPSPKDKKWAMLAKFLESSWFERCWVVQEVVVSQGDPLILCGDQQLLWSVFQKAIVWLSQHTAFRTDRMVLINSIKTISGRQEWDHNESANVVSGLPTLLLLTTLFRATDPKDNIFSLLGLTKETRSTNEWPKVLNPDYSRSVQDLYREVTKYCIRTEGNLSILSQCDCSYSRVKESSFPSWVPRWDLIPSTRRISAFRWTSTPDNCQNVIETFNEASKGTTLAMDEETHINVLRLRGLRLSNVDVCLPTVAIEDPASPPGLPEHLYLFLETKIPEFYNICKEKVRHTSSMPFDKTFFLVTSAGLTPDNQDASHEPLMHFHAFLARTKNTLKKDQPDLDPTESLRSMVKSSLQITMPGSVSPQMATAEGDDSRSTHDRKGESERVRPNPARYLTGLMRLLNRRLFITASGQLGLGPAHMMSGDVVVVLFGGNVPYILRPLESGQWVFVGECYIEGLMRGEAVRGPDFQEESCAWFELV